MWQQPLHRRSPTSTTNSSHRAVSLPGDIPEEEELNPNHNNSFLHHSHHTSLTSLHSLNNLGQLPNHRSSSSSHLNHGGFGGPSHHNHSYHSLFPLSDNGAADNSTGPHPSSQVYAALGLRRPRRQRPQQPHGSGNFHHPRNSSATGTDTMGRSQSMSSVYHSRHRHHHSHHLAVGDETAAGGGGNETFRLGGSYFAPQAGNGHPHSIQVDANGNDANMILRRLNHLMNGQTSSNSVGMGGLGNNRNGSIMGNSRNNGRAAMDTTCANDSSAVVTTTEAARMHHLNGMKMENTVNGNCNFSFAANAHSSIPASKMMMTQMGGESSSFGSSNNNINNNNSCHSSDDDSSSFHPSTSTYHQLNNGTRFLSLSATANVVSGNNASMKMGSASSSPIPEYSYVPRPHHPHPHRPVASDANQSYSSSSNGNNNSSTVVAMNSLLVQGNNHTANNCHRDRNHLSNTTITSNRHTNTVHDNHTIANNNNNNNNNTITGPSKLYRLISTPPDDSTTPLTPRQWATILHRARTHPREACFFDPNLGGHVYALHRLLRRSGEVEGCHPPYEVVEAVMMACPRAVTRKQRVIDDEEFLEEEENGYDVGSRSEEASGGENDNRSFEDGNSEGRNGSRSDHGGGNRIEAEAVMRQQQLNQQHVNPNANLIEYLQRIHGFQQEQNIENRQQQDHQPMEDDDDDDDDDDDHSDDHSRHSRNQPPNNNNPDNDQNDDDDEEEEENPNPNQDNNFHDDVRFEYPLAIACECNQSSRIIRLLASSVLQNSSNPVYRSEVFRSLDYASLPNRIVRILLEEYAGCVLERGTDSEANEGDDDDCPLEKVLFWWDDPDMLDMEMDIENYPNCHMKDDLCDLWEKIRMMLYAAIRGTMVGYDEWKEEFPVLHHALRIVVNGGIGGVKFPNDFAHAVYLLAKFIWKEKRGMFQERDEKGMLPIHIVASGRGFFPLTDVIRVDDQNDGGGAGVMNGNVVSEEVVDNGDIGDDANAVVRDPSRLQNDVQEPNAQDAAAAPRGQQRVQDARHLAGARNGQEAVDDEEVNEEDEDDGNPEETSLENYPSPRQSGLEVVKLILEQYPQSINIPDPQTGSLPIHLMLHHNPLATEVIDYFLELHPDSVTKPNGSGRLPIHIALLQKSSSWEKILKLSPTLLESRDPVTGLLPFQLAATAESSLDETNTITTVTTTTATTTVTEAETEADNGVDTAQQDLDSLTTIFRLLRMSPCLASGLANVKSPPQSLIEQKIMARYKPRVVMLEEENEILRRKVAELERKLMEFQMMESDSSTEQPAATKKRKSSTSSILSMSNFRL